MWFFGILVGLGLGAASSSFSAALILAGIGGFIGAVLGRSQGSASQHQTAELAALHESLGEIRRRLQVLEEQVARNLTDVASQPDRANVAEVAPEIAVQQIVASEEASPPTRPDNTEVEWTEEMLAQADAAPVSPEPTPTPPTAAIVGRTPETPEPTHQNATPNQKAPPAAPQPPAIPLRDRLPAPLSEMIFGGNMLVKLGILILFFGLAFLLRYTAERVTVPMEFRYAGVALSGVGLLVAGWWLRRQRPDVGLVLQGGGIGVFYLTTLAAIKFHALISPGAGFSFMSLVALLSAALAVMQGARILAVIAALEGFATPVLISSGSGEALPLLSYLMVLDIGICAIAWFRAWRLVNLIGFVGTYTLVGAWVSNHYHDDLFAVQSFLIGFMLLFTLIGLRFAIRSLEEAEFTSEQSLAERAGEALRRARVDSALVFGTPITTFGIEYILVRNWEYGPAFAALAFAFFYLLLARRVFSPERPEFRLLAEAYAIVGVIFATLAIPLGLEGVWTGAAWAIEGAGMYWLGLRQHRAYARWFALVVLLGSTVKLLAGLGISPNDSGPLLLGSSIGPILLAASVLVVWRLQKRAALTDGLETQFGALLPWLGIGASALLPWLWWSPAWAAVGLSILALCVFALCQISHDRELRAIVGVLQGSAVFSFLLSLHQGGGLIPLESGTAGTVAAVLIAASLIATSGWGIWNIRRLALAAGVRPRWSVSGSTGIVAAALLLHLAMLFGIDIRQASLIWPITAALLLWVALWIGHTPLAACGFAVQIVAGLLHLWQRAWDIPAGGDALAPMLTHPHFRTAISAALGGSFSAYWLYREHQRDTHPEPPRVSLNPWCAKLVVQWTPLLWGLAFWVLAWLPESDRVLVMFGRHEWQPGAWLLIGLCTSALLCLLAEWRQWRPAGLATLATVPILAISGLDGLIFAQRSGVDFWPSAGLGILAWPLALIWHTVLLRRQECWLDETLLVAPHVAGFWLFLLLATEECQLRLGSIGETWSSWRLLGIALIPALVFWLLRSERMGRLWPLPTFRHAYLVIACAPVALYLFGWIWLTNLFSAGQAAPLPYVPLLNPLEIGHWLLLGALFLWWRTLSPGGPQVAGGVEAAIAVTALALVTGTLLRACHHYGSVEWNLHALFASRLTQAVLAIGWSMIGVGVMVMGVRRVSRSVWIAGAGLLGIVVIKLFAIDLADHGGLYRIVSFIGVGALLLLVGYFAPVPPRAAASNE